MPEKTDVPRTAEGEATEAGKAPKAPRVAMTFKPQGAKPPRCQDAKPPGPEASAMAGLVTSAETEGGNGG